MKAFYIRGMFMLKDMKTHTHLKPGQKGTRRLLEQYGDKLLCVRYRYDELRQVKMKLLRSLWMKDRAGRLCTIVIRTLFPSWRSSPNMPFGTN